MEVEQDPQVMNQSKEIHRLRLLVVLIYFPSRQGDRQGDCFFFFFFCINLSA